MKGFLIAPVFIVSFLFTSNPPNYVRTAIFPPQRSENRVTIREELRQRIQQNIATHSERLSKIKQGRIKQYFSRMIRRLEAAVERLERLILRIESRLTKIKSSEQDLDTTKVEADLFNAKNLLESAKSDIQITRDDFDKLIGSDNLKENFKTIIETVHNIKQQLIQVHKILVQVIGEIKGLRAGRTNTSP